MPIGSKPVASAKAAWNAITIAPMSSDSLIAGFSPSRARTRIAAHAPTASSDHANSEPIASATAPIHGRLERSGIAASSPTVR